MINEGITNEYIDDSIIVPQIKNCARCKGDHSNVKFKKLTHPIESDDSNLSDTHWSPCPTNGEPILLRIVK